MKPVIGITADLDPDSERERSGGVLRVNWNYAQCVANAGGIPLILPPQSDFDSIETLIDGLLIPGGNDIDALTWGEPNHPATKLVAPERFRSESALIAAAPPDLPVLGICYGCQLLNVVRGGSLIQHLPDELGHDLHRGGTLQSYEIESGSKLASAVGSSRAVGKSYHHQAICKTGAGLRPVAKDDEGIIGAIEAVDRPWMLGVQWHPERTMDDEATKNLFSDFIAAARRYRESRHR